MKFPLKPKNTITMGRSWATEKTKYVLRPVKQWEQLGNMHNLISKTFPNKNPPNAMITVCTQWSPDTRPGIAQFTACFAPWPIVSQTCTLDRFTKTFFWNFQSIRADLCYILIYKQMLEKAFCSNIAPSLSSGNHLFYKAEYMGQSCPNQVWAITFDWSALATWNKHFWTAFWRLFSGIPHLPTFHVTWHRAPGTWKSRCQVPAPGTWHIT